MGWGGEGGRGGEGGGEGGGGKRKEESLLPAAEFKFSVFRLLMQYRWLHNAWFIFKLDSVCLSV